MQVPVISTSSQGTRQRIWDSRPDRFLVRSEAHEVQFTSVRDALDYRDTFGGELFDEGNVRLNPHDPLFAGMWVSDESPVAAVTFHDVP